MQEYLLRKSLVMTMDGGIVDGDEVFKRYTYSNVILTADADSLHAAAVALAGFVCRRRA